MSLNCIVLQGETDIDIELDVDPHPASFTDLHHEAVLTSVNYCTLKSENEVGCVFSKLFNPVPVIELMTLMS